MDGFSIGRIILGLQNPELYLKKLKETGKITGFSPELNASLSNAKPQPNPIVQNFQPLTSVTETLQMNYIANIDRSVFIKNLLGLPQNMSQILFNAQNPNSPLNGSTLGVGNLNQELLQNQKTLSMIFDETMPAVPPAQIAAEISQALPTAQPTAQAPAQQDAMVLFFSGMISMTNISKQILQNSRHAVAELIISMASASKQGMSNEQIRETLSIINSCISMAESNNPEQMLKSLMLLYLPWLPLSEGVGFDLEITPPEGENESNDSKLTVLIQTRNFGNVKGVFTLTTSNSVEVLITCSENFPKNLLQKSLMDESKSHAMNTNIDITEVKPQKEELNETREAKVNLSATNEMNPYLLLMAHSFIRNTIIIDSNELDLPSIK